MDAILSVSELASHLKQNIERTYAYVRVKGEMGRISRAPSGHVYADIKDKTSVLSLVIWKGTPLAVQPQEGLEMIASGKLTIFPGQSRYQLMVVHLEASGIGAWMALLEERKKKFLQAGYFDTARKKPLPALPKVIGIVTSPIGAVILDMLHRFKERFGSLHIVLWPVRVQGTEAASEIAQAIYGFNDVTHYAFFPKPDVLIVARGGGSLEDLWCFNEESIIHAVYESAIPIVSAIGHETDTTLVDFVADKRAPTPTAAAEFVVPVLTDILCTLDHLWKRINQAIHRICDRAHYHLSLVVLPTLQDLLSLSWQKLDFIHLAILKAMQHILEKKALEVMHATRLLEAYHYKNILKRGFAIVRHRQEILTHWQSVQKGDSVEIELFDGSKEAILTDKI